MLFLPRSVAGLANVAARETARYSLTALKFRQEPHGGFRAEGTDGRRALIVQEGPVAGEAEIPRYREQLERLAGTLPLEEVVEGLIPSEVIRDAFKSGKPTRHDGDCRLGVLMGTKEALMCMFNSRQFPVGPLFRTPYVEGRFPNIEGFMPKSAPKATFMVDAGLLVELLQGIRPMLNVDCPKVTFCLYGNLFANQECPVALTAEHAGIYSDSIMMPLMPKER